MAEHEEVAAEVQEDIVVVVVEEEGIAVVVSQPPPTVWDVWREAGLLESLSSLLTSPDNPEGAIQAWKRCIPVVVNDKRLRPVAEVSKAVNSKHTELNKTLNGKHLKETGVIFFRTELCPAWYRAIRHFQGPHMPSVTTGSLSLPCDTNIHLVANVGDSFRELGLWKIALPPDAPADWRWPVIRDNYTRKLPGSGYAGEDKGELDIKGPDYINSGRATKELPRIWAWRLSLLYAVLVRAASFETPASNDEYVKYSNLLRRTWEVSGDVDLVTASKPESKINPQATNGHWETIMTYIGNDWTRQYDIAHPLEPQAKRSHKKKRPAPVEAAAVVVFAPPQRVYSRLDDFGDMALLDLPATPAVVAVVEAAAALVSVSRSNSNSNEMLYNPSSFSSSDNLLDSLEGDINFFGVLSSSSRTPSRVTSSRSSSSATFSGSKRQASNTVAAAAAVSQPSVPTWTEGESFGDFLAAVERYQGKEDTDNIFNHIFKQQRTASGSVAQRGPMARLKIR